MGDYSVRMKLALSNKVKKYNHYQFGTAKKKQ